jgi:hypothetical protein
MEFYQEPWEESYNRLRRDIEIRFLRKDTNRKYKPLLISNMDDLVITVVLRLIRINSKLRHAGEEIKNFYAMLENRIDHVYHEELRRIFKHAGSTSRDDASAFETPEPSDPIDRRIEEEEERAIINRCYKECLGKLPEHVLSIFLEYYGKETLTPKERTAARIRLAVKVADISAAEETPERLKRAKNNLDSMISKWRRNHLDPCKDSCLKWGASRP